MRRKKPTLWSDLHRLIIGDALTVLLELPEKSVQCCVTSPPYWNQRNYGVDGQIGRELTPEAHVEALCGVFAEVRRVLRSDGVMWLNYGDMYAAGGKGGGGRFMEMRGEAWKDRKEKNGWRSAPAGMKTKDLIGLPWMIAFALRGQGWYLRNEIIWHKPNAAPEPDRKRCRVTHEHLFLLSKSPSYYFDTDAVRIVNGEESTDEDYAAARGKTMWTHGADSEKGRTGTRSDTKTLRHPKGALRGSVWRIQTAFDGQGHFATFPSDLVKPCILAGSKPGDVILDPFGGSGTTPAAALELGRRALTIELNPKYGKLIERRCDVTPGFAI